MIWQISVAVIAVAFTVLVVFLVRTLVSAQQSLNKTTETLQEIKETIDELSTEVQGVVRQANTITIDLQHKMEQIDPVMESVKNVGEVLNEVTVAARQVSTALIGRMKKPKASRSERTEQLTTVKVEAPVNQQIHESASGAQQQRWVKWVDIAATVWQKYRS